jgi:hypothetical protein
MIEAGVVVGYVIAWAVRKARRAIGRLDSDVDAVVDVGLDRLHEIVTTRLANHPVMARLLGEAERAAMNDGKVGEEIRQQLELALAATAREDEAFGQAVAELANWLAETRQAASHVSPHQPTVLLTGNARAEADHGGIAFGQVAGDVHIARAAASPPQPGRLGH